MIPALRRFGRSQAPVLTLDRIGSEPARIRALAAGLAPFPPATNNYPGARLVLSERHGAAWHYVLALLEAAKPYLAGAFDLDGFDLIEASFSMVTTPPDQLTPVQRMPHFDSVDDDFLAVLHYLSPCAGTAFYRHRASGVELLSPAILEAYVAQARIEAASAAPDYYRVDGPSHELIGSIEGDEGRLVAYPGRLLHSGLIPPEFAGSMDPAVGRLTTNIFIRGWRSG